MAIKLTNDGDVTTADGEVIGKWIVDENDHFHLLSEEHIPAGLAHSRGELRRNIERALFIGPPKPLRVTIPIGDEEVELYNEQNRKWLEIRNEK
jgi:hypothetical protein